MNKNLLKLIGRKILLTKAESTIQTKLMHQKLNDSILLEPTFYFGNKRMRAMSLNIESAPGVAESIISILDSNKILKQEKILDFGCGQHQSLYLKNLGYNIHACDIVPYELENFTLIDPSHKILPFQDEGFDIVIASEVLEHLESPFELLHELLRVTKKFVIVSTPNPASKKSRNQFYRKGYLFWFEPENFNYHISPIFWWQIKLFCKHHNFKLEKMMANHEAFMLDDQNKKIELAEALIFQIGK